MLCRIPRIRRAPRARPSQQKIDKPDLIQWHDENRRAGRADFRSTELLVEKSRTKHVVE